MLCADCGKDIPDISGFCPYCGSKQEGTPRAETPDQPTIRLPGPTIVTPAEQCVPESAAQFAEQAAGMQPPQGQPVPVPGNVAAPGQQQYYQQAPGQPYGQPYVGAAPGQMPPGYQAQFTPTEPKKRNYLPFIIIGAVLVLAFIIGGIVFAVNVLGGSKSMAAIVYEGTENLLYDTSSADMELDIDMGGQSIGLGVKWDLGVDLKSSTVWLTIESGFAGTTGLVLIDDTVHGYMQSGPGGYTKMMEESDAVDMLSQALSEEYGFDVDLNGVVKNGKFDKNHIADLNAKIGEAQGAGSMPNSEVDGDYSKVSEILLGFVLTEASKKEVFEQFMGSFEAVTEGTTSRLTMNIDVSAFYEALGAYASERGRDGNYADAADIVIETCDSLEDLGISGDLDIETLVTDKKLRQFDLTLGASSNRLGISLDVLATDATGFSLNGDAELEAIINAEASSSSLASPLDIF